MTALKGLKTDDRREEERLLQGRRRKNTYLLFTFASPETIEGLEMS